MPIPAAARYSISGEPSPPAPITSTRAAFSFAWPMPPDLLQQDVAGVALDFVFREIEVHAPDDRMTRWQMTGDRGTMTQPSQTEDNALVLFSGGQDFDHLPRLGAGALSACGNRRLPLRPAPRGRDGLPRTDPAGAGARPALGVDHVVDLTATIAGLGETAMTADIAIEMDRGGLPNTFVPGRNLLFLTCAAAIAYRRGLRRIVAGVCETDFSGYPDCRDDTVKAMQLALNLGMERRFVLETPLMWRDKAATWALAFDLGGQALVEVIRERTHTCYLGDRTHRHAWGFGCGTCPACLLRAQGWERWSAGRPAVWPGARHFLTGEILMKTTSRPRAPRIRRDHDQRGDVRCMGRRGDYHPHQHGWRAGRQLWGQPA